MVSLVVNAAVVVSAGRVARFLQQRPVWARWQRRFTGTLLGTMAVLAREAPERARV
jgi:threonine/homoserine/homoserine lactone efflux protein